jgi:hypothetical protein
VALVLTVAASPAPSLRAQVAAATTTAAASWVERGAGDITASLETPGETSAAPTQAARP